jgi:hypothetical protein
MKRIACFLALVPLALGCRHGSQPETLEQLIKTCQQHTGANFTYNDEVAGVLRGHDCRLEQAQRTPDAWMELLRGALADQGLEVASVGPERVKVWLVRRKSS